MFLGMDTIQPITVSNRKENLPISSCLPIRIPPHFKHLPWITKVETVEILHDSYCNVTDAIFYFIYLFTYAIYLLYLF